MPMVVWRRGFGTACVLMLAGCFSTRDDFCAQRWSLLDQDADGYANDQWEESFSADGCDLSMMVGIGDCDDSDGALNPGAAEVCDGVDNDCDGESDPANSNDSRTWYLDRDDDSYGNDAETLQGCEAPPGYVEQGGDCDDGSAQANPGEVESCSEGDQDCDGQVDEGEPEGATSWWVDEDGDGFGSDDSEPVLACDPPSGTVDEPGDCDDTDGLVNPDAIEICSDGIDNDCDGGASGCGLAGRLSTGDADIVISGDEADDRLGEVLAGAEDLTGDGEVDLLLGAPFSNLNGDYSGAVFILSGPFYSDRSIAEADATLVGDYANDGAGSSVAVAHDLSGDGWPDLVIGASYGYGGGQAGQVHLVLGPVSGLRDLEGSDTALPGSDGDRAGWRVVAIDGVSSSTGPGFGVGAPHATGFADDAGVLHICSGTAEGLSALDECGGAVAGVEEGLALGQVVASPQDVDGDDISDYLVGLSAESTAGKDAGAAYLILGPVIGQHAVTDADLSLFGAEEDEELGGGVELTEDWTGDGYPDVVIASPRYGDQGSQVGRVLVVPGDLRGEYTATAASEVQLIGSGPGGNLGQSIASVPDTDDDGKSELVVGAPRASEKQSWAGHACFLFGGTTGQLGLSDCDGLIEAEHEDTLLGLSLAAVPDVNGDGFPEVIFGAGQLPDGDEGIGGAFLFLGGSL